MKNLSEQLRTPEGRDWLALQYVLGELTTADTVAFEHLLEHDELLCEAVIVASRLVQGLRGGIVDQQGVVVERGSPSVRPAGVRWAGRMVGTAALATVMCLAVGFSLSSISSTADEATVSAYAGLIAEEISEAESESEVDATLLESGITLEAPEWLLTAVELESGEISADELDSQGPEAVF